MEYVIWDTLLILYIYVQGGFSDNTKSLTGRTLPHMQYRRATTPDATSFFTVVSYNRQRLFKTPETIQLLRQSFYTVKQRHPFDIDTIVVLPDHLHCLWTLPDEDADFSTRWRLIKTYFSRRCPNRHKRKPSVSCIKKKAQAI